MNKVKRTILILLVAVTLFLITTLIQAANDPKWRIIIHGAATIVLMVGIVSLITLIIDYLKEGKQDI